MPRVDSTNLLVGWEGYTVKHVERIEPAAEGDRPRVEITLTRATPTLRCAGCGQTTTRVHEVTVRCVRDLPVQRVAAFYALDWDTVKTLDAAALADRLLPVDLSTVTTIAMDEFALRKGHRYATVVVEPARKRVLWVGRAQPGGGPPLLHPAGGGGLPAPVGGGDGYARRL